MTTVKIGNCTLILGNSYEIAPTLGMFDALVSDPQYDFETSGGGKMRKERKCMEQIIEKGLDKGFDPNIINSLLYRSVVVFCHNDQLHKLLPFFFGNYHRYALCVWKKNNPAPFCNKNYQADIEPYIHAWNRGGHPVGLFNKEVNEMKRTVVTNNGKSEFDHPTVKPLEVMMKIMRNVNGNTIIDPFMGTGTTGVAAVKLGKSFTGIEHDKDFFDIAVERIKKTVDEQKTINDNTFTTNTTQ